MAGFDLVVIGSGPAGYVAAIRAAQLGASVAIVEERHLGGTCLNRGCIPTKALLETARVFHNMKHAAEFGLRCESPAADYSAVAARKTAITERVRKGVTFLLNKSKVEVIAGHARLADPHTVEVATGSELRRIEGKHVLIATGSEPARPKIFPFDNQRVITSDEALELTQLPASILIVGGGIIGCEFASMWSELGAKVIVVEMLPRLLSVLDEDLSAEMYRTFRRSKVAVHLGVKMERITSCDSGVRAELADGKWIEADIALVAVGRKLNSDLDGLASLGVKIERNAVPVDEFGRTNIEGLYAAGDVTGRWLLAHYASEQAVVAAEHMFGSQPEPLKEDAIPNCVFTIPEIANVGLSEVDARARGITYKVGRFPMLALGKAQAAGDTAGFVKLIADENGKVIGAHMIGHEVTSMIAEVTLAVRLGLKVNELIHTVHAHPTMPEGTHEAALDVFGRAIHK